MSDTSHGDRVEELVVESLELAETKGWSAVLALLEREPQHAEAVTKELEKLRVLGLFAGERAGAHADRVGDYRLVTELGRGSQSIVYLAHDERLRRRVALKLYLGPAAEARRHAEAAALARAQHPAIVAVHGAGTAAASPAAGGEARAWLATEWIDGPPLPAWLAEDPARRAPRTLLPIFATLARGLAHAHAHGIVHGDLKLEHVLMRSDARPVLVDFELGATAPEALGDLRHAAPERLTGAAASPRSDQYGLASMLRSALHGAARGRQRLVEELELVLATASADDPRERYADCAELAADLEAVLAFTPLRAQRVPWLRRAWRAARRRPILALAVLAFLACGAAGACVGLVHAQQQQRQRAALARAAGERTFALLPQVAVLARRLSDLRDETRAQRTALERRHVPAEELALLSARAQQTAKAHQEVEALVHTLRQELLLVSEIDPPAARRLRPRVLDAEAQLARAYGERRDVLALRSLRDALARQESSGSSGSNGSGSNGSNAWTPTDHGWLELGCEVAGASAFVFAAVPIADHEGLGEERSIYVPVATDSAAAGSVATVAGSGATSVRPPAPSSAAEQQFCLRVVDGGGKLELDDLIVRVADLPVANTVFVLSAADSIQAMDQLWAIDGQRVHDLYAIDYVAPGAHEFTFARGKEQYRLTGTRQSLALRCVDARGLVERGPASGLSVRATIRSSDKERTSSGQERIEVLPRGLVVRPTAAPLPTWSCASRGLPQRHTLVEGEYLALVRAPECIDLRVPVRIVPGHTTRLLLRPPLRANALPGFVPVVDADAPEAWFWMQEREVTVAEYLEFLNAPGLAGAGSRAEHAPRRGTGTGFEPFLVPDRNGRYALPPGWYPEHPIFGVTQDDAEQFAAWCTARDGTRYRVRFGLPTAQQWQVASCVHVGRSHVFGEGFEPHWVRTHLARPALNLEPGLRFVRDESPFGIFDLAGNQAEWGASAPNAAGERVPYLGGSMLESAGWKFRGDTVSEAPKETTSMVIGFRLVAIPLRG